MWSMDPWWVPETLTSEGPRDQNYFILKTICFLHRVDIFTDGTKAMMRTSLWSSG